MRNDSETLKYLFKATFKDGTIIEQTPDDRSSVEPMTRSAFFDVLEHEKVSQLTRFELFGEGHRYAVCFPDGHFETDGLPFKMHEGPLEFAGLRLIYFRNHTRHFAAGTGPQAGGQIGHELVYRIGWQYTMKGHNYQQVMQID